MQLIDANSERIPEGDYLAMCNAMKEVHGKMKPETVIVHPVSYYDYEDELSKVVIELNRLHKQRDNIHYRTKVTKVMKTDAIREYAFTEGLHSLREHTVEALEEAGVRINTDNLFGKYLENFNYDIYEKKKAIHLMIQEVRDYRDNLIRDMVDNNM